MKLAGIKDVDAFFYVNDLDKDIASKMKDSYVSSRGYMLGYNDLKDKSIPSSFRLLSKIGDGMMKMKIVKIEFHE